MSELVSLSREGEIGIITINNPPVNALSPGVPEGLLSCLRAAQNDSGIRAIVLVGGGKTFVAGADIKEFVKMTAGTRDRKVGLYPLMSQLEECAKPVVCGIHGTALGGGLELAMACHYRVAVRSAQMGQPEVKLGLIPGAGGTQRLPRLTGLAKAIEMCTLGNPIKAGAALQYGIVDELCEGDLVACAVEFARGILKTGGPPRKTRDQRHKLGDPSVNIDLCESARNEVRERDRGRVAPLKAIDAIEAAAQLPFEQGIACEEALFEECLFSDESKALIHLFLAEREVSKIPGIAKETPVSDIRKAAVVGAGKLGTGIAMTFADAGIPVLLSEISQEAAENAMLSIRNAYSELVEGGRITGENVEKRLKLIQTALDYDGFGEADIVVETMPEGLDPKQQVFDRLGRVCRPDAILASSTGSLDLDRLASATACPERVLGLHFFESPYAARLLEIVRCQTTAAGALASSMILAKKLGKIGVLVGICRHFVVGRMRLAYQREAEFLAGDGARIQEIDAALYNFGMARGSLAQIVQSANSSRTISAMEIVDRAVCALVNEGARILGEGIASRASDIDIIGVHGCCFPAHRGGPMWFADTVGVANIHARIRELEHVQGSRWTPAPLLDQLASNGRTFADYDAGRT